MAKFKGLIKHCEVCDTEFKVSQSQSRVRTCSAECGYKIRKVANKKDKVELKCMHCSKPIFEFPSHVDRRKFCSKECVQSNPDVLQAKSIRISGDKNPGWKGGVGVRSVSASGKLYTRAQPHIEIERVARRKRVVSKATPNWASTTIIREIYRQAQSASKSTSEKYHVDHIVPLKSKLVCGLHTEHNLRILPALDNLKKHNRTWPDMW